MRSFIKHVVTYLVLCCMGPALYGKDARITPTTLGTNEGLLKIEAATSGDIEIRKTVNPLNPTLNSTFTYTITVRNIGQGVVPVLNVTDTFPAGMQFISAQASKGTWSGIWIVGAMQPNETATLVITAKRTGDQGFENCANANAANDNNYTNNRSCASVPACPIEPVGGADVSILKTTSTDTPAPGSGFFYNITVRNNSQVVANNVVVTDVLPAQVRLLNTQVVLGNWTGNTWNVGSLPPGFAVTLRLYVERLSDVEITNCATVASANDPNPSNNRSCATVPWCPTPTPTNTPADISIRKTTSVANPGFNSIFNYVITVQNIGQGGSQMVNVSDILPTGLQLMSSQVSIGTVSGSVWTIGGMAAGATATWTLTVRRLADQAIENCANLNAQNDNNGANNRSCITIPTVPAEPVGGADLRITKTATNDTPAPGSGFGYVLTVQNMSQVAASNVVVTDPLPSLVRYTNSQASQGTWSGSTWTVGTLQAGQTATLTIYVERTSDAEIQNCATVTAPNDPNPANNRSCHTLPWCPTPTPNTPTDIAITKRVNPASPALGATFGYAITVQNIGQSGSQMVNVSDVLPAGLELVGSQVSIGTVSGNVWTIGGMAAGATANWLLTVKRTGEQAIENCASLNAMGDSNINNNRSCATIPAVSVTPTYADIVIRKTVETANPTFNANFNYILTVQNIGQGVAPVVNVSDVLPVGLQFVNAQATTGTVNGTVWTVGAMQPGQTATMTLTVKRTGDQAIQNCADANAANDNNYTNNRSCVTIPPCPIEPAVTTADVRINKTINTSSPTPGSSFGYVITVQNMSAVAANNVMVLDQLPSQVLFRSAQSSQGTWSGSTWNVGTLQAGQTATLTILVERASDAEINNCATVTSANDPNPANNRSCHTLPWCPPTTADVYPTILLSNNNPRLNENFNVVLDVKNGSTADAMGVSATLNFGGGFSSQGSTAPFQPAWGAGIIAPWGTKRLVITGVRSNPNPFTICANTSLNGTDTNPANNQVCVNIPAAQ